MAVDYLLKRAHTDVFVFGALTSLNIERNGLTWNRLEKRMNKKVNDELQKPTIYFFPCFQVHQHLVIVQYIVCIVVGPISSENIGYKVLKFCSKNMLDSKSNIMNRNLCHYYKSLLHTAISGAQKRTRGASDSDSEDEEETRHKPNVSCKSEIICAWKKRK